MTERDDGTVGKALEVLDLVAAQGRPVRFVDLQRISPLPKATLYRLVKTLVNQSMLVQLPEGGLYALGPRVVRLAQAAVRHVTLSDIARPHLDVLASQTGLLVQLAQLDHGFVLYLDRRSLHETAPDLTSTRLSPAYCTAAGKAMLAYLPEEMLELVLATQTFDRYTPTTLASEVVLLQSLDRAKSRGYAVDREEHEPGVICVGAPILGAHGQVLGAVSLAASTATTNLQELEAQAPKVMACATKIADEARNWAFSNEGPPATRGRQE